MKDPSNNLYPVKVNKVEVQGFLVRFLSRGAGQPLRATCDSEKVGFCEWCYAHPGSARADSSNCSEYTLHKYGLASW